MAVYTKLSASSIENILSAYDIGSLDNFQEISSGIENTNYFVDTKMLSPKNIMVESEWVLTIFENVDRDQLPYFCQLTEHLSGEGFEVPAPIRSKAGNFTFTYADKVGLIVPKLKGISLAYPQKEDCAAVGAYLATMHLCLARFTLKRELQRDLVWVESQSELLNAKISDSDRELMDKLLGRYKACQSKLLQCPQGTVHGDLFKDNVLFDNGKVSGVFDFYHACDATLLFDLAVIANDWTFDDGEYDNIKLIALTSAYQAIRPWTEMEHQMWLACLELAALRFWLSRLTSIHLPGYQQKSVSGDTLKNPDEMKTILLSLIKNAI